MPRSESRPSVTDVAVKRRLMNWLNVGIQNERGIKRRKLPTVVGSFREQLHYQDRAQARKKFDAYLIMVEKTIVTIRKEIDQI